MFLKVPDLTQKNKQKIILQSRIAYAIIPEKKQAGIGNPRIPGLCVSTVRGFLFFPNSHMPLPLYPRRSTAPGQACPALCTSKSGPQPWQSPGSWPCSPVLQFQGFRRLAKLPVIVLRALSGYAIPMQLSGTVFLAYNPAARARFLQKPPVWASAPEQSARTTPVLLSYAPLSRTVFVLRLYYKPWFFLQ